MAFFCTGAAIQSSGSGRKGSFEVAEHKRPRIVEENKTPIMAEDSTLDTSNGWLPMTVEIQQCSEAECCA